MGRDLIHFFFMLVVFSLELRLSWYFHQSVVTHIATSALALHITCPFFPFFLLFTVRFVEKYLKSAQVTC